MDRVDRGIFGGASKEFQQSSSAVSNPPSGLQLLLLEPETNFQKLSSEMIFNFLRQIGGIYLVQTLTARCVEAEEGGRSTLGLILLHFYFLDIPVD